MLVNKIGPYFLLFMHKFMRFTRNSIYFQFSSIYVVHSAVVVFLFLAGLWFTGAIINGPNFKVDFGGPNYRLKRLMLRLMLTGPAGLC